MRLRTRLGLVGRAVAALAVEGSLLLGVGGVLTFFGALFGLGLVGALSSVGSGDLSLAWALGSMLVGAVVTLLAWARIVRREFRHGRIQLLSDTRDPETERERASAETVARLAQQVDRSAPAVVVRETADPQCYTVPDADGPVLVVSTGLVATLSVAERDAVLAHEVAHLANRDHRVMTPVLAPLVATEELAHTVDDDSSDPRELFWVAVYGALTWWGAVGVGVFSRGRELAADTAAAELTGDPAALANALRRLDAAATEAPSEDLREHARTVDALSVHPTLDPSTDDGGGLTATHPATETRIERLGRLVDRVETA